MHKLIRYNLILFLTLPIFLVHVAFHFFNFYQNPKNSIPIVQLPTPNVLALNFSHILNS